MKYRANIRPKRRPGTVTHHRERVVVSMPLRVKNQVRRIARENEVGQGEFVWLILRAAISDHAWLDVVLAEDREAKQQAASALWG